MKTRHTVLVIGLLLLAGVSSSVYADMGGFHIVWLHADLDVQPNSELLVTERIEVQFHEPRRGIYRTIPVRYTDPRGYDYTLGFRLLDVTDEDGKPYGTKVSRHRRFTKVRIGSPEIEVQGRRVYVLRYRVARALVHFPEHDELYWNVTGYDWNVPIDAASAKVHLPGDPGQALRTLAWTGYRTYQKEEPEAGRGALHFYAGRPLVAGEGLMLAVAWPHGLVRFPGPVSRAIRFLLDNWLLLVPLVVLVLLWSLHRAHGRDLEGATAVMVRYEPPPGITPAELGTLMDDTVDMRDITATVVDLAVRGYVDIRKEVKEHLSSSLWNVQFHRLRGESEDGLKQHEKLVLRALFADRDRVKMFDLRERFYRCISFIKNALYEQLIHDKLFAVHPIKVEWKYGCAGFLVGGATFVVGLLSAISRGTAFPYSMIVPAVCGAACLVMFLKYARAMPRRTRKGVDVRNWGKGFEEFIERVEGERVDAEDAPEVFERLLPYSMALGLAASWARKFEGIYLADGGPNWYVGDDSADVSTHDFEHNLSTVMSRARTAMLDTPRSRSSSGSSSGSSSYRSSSSSGFRSGGSGGGRGGGGGGSW